MDPLGQKSSTLLIESEVLYLHGDISACLLVMTEILKEYV